MAVPKVFVQNYYFPKAGKEAAVYEQRLRVSEIRTELGLRKGQVFKEAGTGKPCVVWQCQYPSQVSRDKDVELLLKSEEFIQARKRMRALVAKFERNVQEID